MTDHLSASTVRNFAVNACSRVSAGAGITNALVLGKEHEENAGVVFALIDQRLLFVVALIICNIHLFHSSQPHQTSQSFEYSQTIRCEVMVNQDYTLYKPCIETCKFCECCCA